MYPATPLGPMAATGISASATGLAAQTTSGWTSLTLNGVFVLVALFTLLAATGALARIAPAVGWLHRLPAKKAPSQDDLMAMSRVYRRTGQHRRR